MFLVKKFFVAKNGKNKKILINNEGNVVDEDDIVYEDVKYINDNMNFSY